MAAAKPAIEIDQALVDIQDWIEKHPRRSEGEIKSLALAEKIVDLFLVTPYLEGDTSAEDYDSDVLFAFAFYLSRDKEFGFTRTFLNDKAEDFIKTKKSTRRLFEVIISHFNGVIKILDKQLRPYRIQYNDLYVFLYDNTEKRWKARIKNGNLDNMINYGKPSFQVCQKTKSITTNEVVYTANVYTQGDPKEAAEDLKIILV